MDDLIITNLLSSIGFSERYEIVSSPTVHHSTLMSMNNLAEVLSHQGKYDEAEVMYQQALAVMEMVLGKEHPETLSSVSSLANMLNHQSKHEEAKKIHQQVLNDKRRVLGKEHPSILRSMNNLGGVLGYQGKDEAEEMHRQAISVMEGVLGKSTFRDIKDQE